MEKVAGSRVLLDGSVIHCAADPVWPSFSQCQWPQTSPGWRTVQAVCVQLKARMEKVAGAGSVYALALDARGKLLLASAPGGSCFMVDALSGTPIGELRGHTDNVRHALSGLRTGARPSKVQLSCTPLCGACEHGGQPVPAQPSRSALCGSFPRWAQRKPGLSTWTQPG